jgi:Leucine-rich repeat (LRR) protein
MDAAILKASAVGAKHFTLDNKKLNAVPKTIGRLESVEMLSMKSNKITKLPPELGLLRNLISLNVGNNSLTCLDRPLSSLWRLETLHLYQNQLTELDVQVLREFTLLCSQGYCMLPLYLLLGHVWCVPEHATFSISIFQRKTDCLLVNVPSYTTFAGSFLNLKLFNLNNNYLMLLPPEIKQ